MSNRGRRPDPALLVGVVNRRDLPHLRHVGSFVTRHFGHGPCWGTNDLSSYTSCLTGDGAENAEDWAWHLVVD